MNTLRHENLKEENERKKRKKKKRITPEKENRKKNEAHLKKWKRKRESCHEKENSKKENVNHTLTKKTEKIKAGTIAARWERRRHADLSRRLVWKLNFSKKPDEALLRHHSVNTAFTGDTGTQFDFFVPQCMLLLSFVFVFFFVASVYDSFMMFICFCFFFVSTVYDSFFLCSFIFVFFFVSSVYDSFMMLICFCFFSLSRLFLYFLICRNHLLDADTG